MYTINEKRKEKNQQIQEKAPKRQGGHFFAPNPKTCTQYKERKNQLTNKSKE
jgi:hypothetical protein